MCAPEGSLQFNRCRLFGCVSKAGLSVAALKLGGRGSVTGVGGSSMILLSTALALVSAGGIVGAPAWADAFSLVFVVSTFVAVCAAEGSPH